MRSQQAFILRFAERLYDISTSLIVNRLQSARYEVRFPSVVTVVGAPNTSFVRKGTYLVCEFFLSSGHVVTRILAE